MWSTYILLSLYVSKEQRQQTQALFSLFLLQSNGVVLFVHRQFVRVHVYNSIEILLSIISLFIDGRPKPVYVQSQALVDDAKAAVDTLPQNHKVVRNDLPTFSMSDVSKHNTT